MLDDAGRAVPKGVDGSCTVNTDTSGLYHEVLFIKILIVRVPGLLVGVVFCCFVHFSFLLEDNGSLLSRGNIYLSHFPGYLFKISF